MGERADRYFRIDQVFLGHDGLQVQKSIGITRQDNWADRSI